MSRNLGRIVAAVRSSPSLPTQSSDRSARYDGEGESILEDLIAYVSRHGVWLVFVNVFVEQLGIPVPALPTLIVAGALAARGDLSAPQVLLAALLAAMIADAIWYALGRRHGNRLLKALCRVSLSPDSCVRQTQGIFERWGMGSLVASKFITGFSTVGPTLAGAMGAKPGVFLLYDVLGILLWAGAGVGAGLLFHDAVESVLVSLESLGTGALALLGTALGLFVFLKWWQRRRFYKALRMARITAEELARMLAIDQPPLVLDVRSETGRRSDPRRIPGAHAMSLEELDEKLRALPTDREIVLYCT